MSQRIAQQMGSPSSASPQHWLNRDSLSSEAGLSGLGFYPAAALINDKPGVITNTVYPAGNFSRIAKHCERDDLTLTAALRNDKRSVGTNTVLEDRDRTIPFFEALSEMWGFIQGSPDIKAILMAKIPVLFEGVKTMEKEFLAHVTLSRHIPNDRAFSTKNHTQVTRLLNHLRDQIDKGKRLAIYSNKYIHTEAKILHTRRAHPIPNARPKAYSYGRTLTTPVHHIVDSGSSSEQPEVLSPLSPDTPCPHTPILPFQPRFLNSTSPFDTEDELTPPFDAHCKLPLPFPQSRFFRDTIMDENKEFTKYTGAIGSPVNLISEFDGKTDSEARGNQWWK